MKLIGLTARCVASALFFVLAGMMVNGIIANVASVISNSVLVLCLLAAVAFLFLPWVIKLVKLLWKHIGGRIALVIITFCISVVIICGSVFSAIICSQTANNAPDDAELVIILGYQITGATPGVYLAQRLDTALTYLESNDKAKIIVTGGLGRNAEISEAEAMKAYLVANGIAAERIFTECNSHNTRENFLFSKQVSDENGLGNKAVIITHDFHQYRAKHLAEYYGFEATHYSAQTDFMSLPAFLVREWAALGNDLLGTAFGAKPTD